MATLQGPIRFHVDVVYMEWVCSCRNNNWQDTKRVLLSNFQFSQI